MRQGAALDMGDDEEAWLNIRLSEHVGTEAPSFSSSLGIYPAENIVVEGTLSTKRLTT